MWDGHDPQGRHLTVTSTAHPMVETLTTQNASAKAKLSSNSWPRRMGTFELPINRAVFPSGHS